MLKPRLWRHFALKSDVHVPLTYGRFIWTVTEKPPAPPWKGVLLPVSVGHSGAEVWVANLLPKAATFNVYAQAGELIHSADMWTVNGNSLEKFQADGIGRWWIL